MVETKANHSVDGGYMCIGYHTSLASRLAVVFLRPSFGSTGKVVKSVTRPSVDSTATQMSRMPLLLVVSCQRNHQQTGL
jgi:hypothetical protein